MKKLVSLLLTVCLLLSAGAALAEEKVELTAFQYALENQNTDFNNLWFFEELEKKTNTHVKFDMVKDADWSTNVNLMFAVPDQMPDMILRNPVDVEEYAKTHFEKAVKKTLTIPAWLNTAALEQNINFSQVLQDALKAQLHMG